MRSAGRFGTYVFDIVTPDARRCSCFTKSYAKCAPAPRPGAARGAGRRAPDGSRARWGAQGAGGWWLRGRGGRYVRGTGSLLSENFYDAEGRRAPVAGCGAGPRRGGAGRG